MVCHVPIRVDEDVIIDFGLDRYPPEVVLEELHELLSRPVDEVVSGNLRFG